MDRVILHSDINACFANIELLFDSSLAGKPMAVCGDAQTRRGIVLSKDELAKACGVKTGMTIWQAKQLCPGLQVVAPHYELYKKYSGIIQDIYRQYTDLCEPMGLDESWLDISNCLSCADGEATAYEIKRRIFLETGLTVSIGVSWNKVLAKLGSDYKKPDAVTVISRKNFESLVWPLPSSDMLMVGRSTAAILSSMGIRTIGELAQANPELLSRRLGKLGVQIHAYANGIDYSPVRRLGDSPPAKSIGNSTTTARDMVCDRDAALVFSSLCESVSSRLRRHGFKCRTLEISLRGSDLHWTRHRMILQRPSDCKAELYDGSLLLFTQCHSWPAPLRSLGVRALDLCEADAPEQLDLFSDYSKAEQQQEIDRTIDSIRDKYGKNILKRGVSFS